MKTGSASTAAAFLLFTLFFFGFLSSAFGGVHRVSGSGEALREAVVNAAPHDTIYVEPGHYSIELLVLDKPVSLIGIDLPVLDSEGGDEIIVVQADSVVVHGFQLQNIGVSYIKDRAAIRLARVKYVTVSNNVLNNTFFGIYLQYSESCVIKNNVITGKDANEVNSGNAIHIWKGDRIIVSNNTLTNHRDGIYFEFVDNSLITGNISENNLRYGLHFMFSNNDVYEDNVFRNNGAGVAVMFSKNITMLRNRFEENWGGASYGILLKEISDGHMAQNTFYRNTVGIYAEGANRIKIEHNKFLNNGQAIDIKGNCLDNEILSNDFVGNTFEVITNAKQNLNHFEGNYWSQYRGYDLNRDGIGDIPHRPVSLFALITDKIPASSILLHSFLINSLEVAERIFPQLIPEQLIDESPSMKPVAEHD